MDSLLVGFVPTSCCYQWLWRIEWFWGRGINGVGDCNSSSRLYQWHWLQGINVCTLADVDIGGFFSVIGAPHTDNLLAGFEGLGCVEARFHKIETLLQSSQLLRREESKNILRKQLSMYVQIWYVHK